MTRVQSQRDVFGRRGLLLLAIITLLGALLPSAGAAHRPAPLDVVVQALPGAVDDAAASVRAVGGTVGRALPIIDGFAARIPGGSDAALVATPAVRAVTPDISLQPRSTTWDAAADPGSLHSIGDAVEAGFLYEQGVTGRGVGVALIDSGVVPVEGLDSGVVHGPDLSLEGSVVEEHRHLDTFGHGTHMAGIIAGRDSTWTPTERSGFAGIAPEATLVSVKVADYDGAADVSQVIAAIDWVAAHRHDPALNIRVLALAYGTDSTQDPRLDPLSYAVERAWHSGIFTVVSAGNGGGGLTMPALNPYVFAVGANDHGGTKSTHDDHIPEWSNRGDGFRDPDVVAPGRSVVSLRSSGSFVDEHNPGSRVADRYTRGSGTSQAAAVAAGSAALLLQHRPSLTPDELKYVLRTSAQFMPGEERTAQGRGVLNVKHAAQLDVPPGVDQTWPRAEGTGSLDAARGSLRLLDAKGQELDTEETVGGTVWDGAAWAGASAEQLWADGAWLGGDWHSNRWSSNRWSSNRWSSNRWSSNRWSGEGWSSNRWSSNRWSSNRWSSNRWSSNRWSSNRWSSAAWN